MKLCVLGSGSSGNCIAFWNEGFGLLYDVGLSYAETIRRMDTLDVDPNWFKVGLVSHRHGDHTRSVRRWMEWHGMTFYATHETMEEVDAFQIYPQFVSVFDPGQTVNPNGFAVQSCPCIHATVGAATFHITSVNRKVACFLETGKVTAEMWNAGRGAQVYLIEANYDHRLNVLDQTRPEKINTRTRQTHLSIQQYAMLLRALPTSCHTVVACHLSADHCSPDLVQEVSAEALRGRDIRLIVAKADKPTEVIDV